MKFRQTSRNSHLHYKKTSLIKALFTLLFLIGLSPMVNAASDSFRVVGYFVNWYNPLAEARAMDYSKVTHINWAFINIINAQGDLENASSNFSALDTLVARAHAKGVKVCMSLGGGDLGGAKQWYINLNAASVTSASARGNYIHKYVAFIEKHKLDGIDVDLEMDNIKKGPYDFFIKGLVDSLRPKGKLITAALNGDGTDNFNDSTVAKFDWINIMSYDWTGSWTPNNPGPHASYEQALSGVSGWSKRGAKKEQLTVGVPFYCHAFLDDKGTDYMNYNEILPKFPDAYKKDSVGNMIYYNGIPTIQRKTAMAIEKAGGIMIWALQYDVTGSKSLLNAIDDARKNYKANDAAPFVTILTPNADTTINVDNINIVALANDTDGVYQKTNCRINGVQIAEGFTGTDTFKLKNLSAGTYEIIAEGLDYQFKKGYDTIKLTVSSSVARSPYNGTIVTFPGKIEAENYDIGAADITYKDNTAGNSFKMYRADGVDIESCRDIGGGYNISNFSAGEWVEYTVNVANGGNYDFEYRVASSVASTFSISIDGTDVSGTVNVANYGKLGSLKIWKSITSKNISLSQGQHVMRVNFLTGNFSLNYIKVKEYVPSSINEITCSGLKVFPNPANDILKIQLENTATESVKIDIIDIAGNVLKSQNCNLYPTKEESIDIASLKAGVYFVKVESINGSQTERFMKK